MTPSVVEAVLVDTDVFSYLMSGKNYAKLYRTHVEGKLVAVSFITVGELYFGAYRKQWAQERLDDLKDRLRKATIVPYDESVCRTYGDIKATMETKGKGVSANDLWIAACAVRHGIPLVTNNSKHFEGIPGLVLRSEVQAMREMQSQTSFAAEVMASSSEPQQPSSQSSAASEEKAPPPAPRRP